MHKTIQKTVDDFLPERECIIYQRLNVKRARRFMRSTNLPQPVTYAFPGIPAPQGRFSSVAVRIMVVNDHRRRTPWKTS